MAITNNLNNDPQVNWNSETGELSISYGRTIFQGCISKNAQVSWGIQKSKPEPVYLGYDHGPEVAGEVPEGVTANSLVISINNVEGVSLSGTVNGNSDAFACLPKGGDDIIRCSYGQSQSLLNRGVFDRSGDWVLWVSEPANSAVQYLNDGEFELSADGPEIRLELMLDFYRNHRGYFHWKPEREAWKEPVAGWCSWAAYYQGVTEDQILAVSDLFSKELKDFGYDVIQIDDGYQTFNQNATEPLALGEKVADYWVSSRPNQFPHGMQWLAEQISARGLTPGIWISTALPLGMPEEWYVKDADGNTYQGPWVQYAINGMIDEATDAAFKQTIRGLKDQGWKYFKIDTLRHIIYDSYRKVPEYWSARGENPDIAYRGILEAIKEEIGSSIYMLACWGTIPEFAGIPDGCRIGEDVGAVWESALISAKHTSQFNYLNNILWRNDPDYMCFRLTFEQCRTWASFVSLTGQQIMVSDPAEAYDEPKLDILRRVGPPIFTKPLNLHPIMSAPELWTLEIDDAEAPYIVLDRIAWNQDGLPERRIRFADLGLPANTSYLVFDFWNEQFMGEFTEDFPAEAIAEGDCRVYAIRPSLGRPQVLSTNRHISQGAYELEDVAWDGTILSGKMNLPAGHEFSIFIYSPNEYKPANADTQNGIIKLTLNSEQGGLVPWSVSFNN